MNGAHFNGRIEKRFPTLVPVYLASLEEPRARERTLTENVSAHGARIISPWSWQYGEQSLITPLTGELSQVGRVVYRLPNGEDRVCLGVVFPAGTVQRGADCSVFHGLPA